MNNTGNQCITCGKDITFKRSDAKYCSDRCRMRFQRKTKKIELIEELFNICSQIPHHTFKNDNGEILMKLHKALKNNQEMVTISDLLELSVSKIEELIVEKQKEVNINAVVNGLRNLFKK